MNIYTNTNKVDQYRGLPITPHIVLAPFIDLAACFEQFRDGKVPCETGQIFPVNYKMEDQREPEWKPGENF